MTLGHRFRLKDTSAGHETLCLAIGFPRLRARQQHQREVTVAPAGHGRSPHRIDSLIAQPCVRAFARRRISASEMASTNLVQRAQSIHRLRSRRRCAWAPVATSASGHGKPAPASSVVHTAASAMLRYRTRTWPVVARTCKGNPCRMGLSGRSPSNRMENTRKPGIA